jgi:hypothetical protein
MDRLSELFAGPVAFRPARSFPTWSPARPLRTTAYDTNWPQNQLPGERVSLEAQKRPSVDMVKLERDARELAELSATIPANINRANSGLLSKDVIDKLKRVEKLSKQRSYVVS